MRCPDPPAPTPHQDLAALPGADAARRRFVKRATARAWLIRCTRTSGECLVEVAGAAVVQPAGLRELNSCQKASAAAGSGMFVISAAGGLSGKSFSSDSPSTS